MPSPPPNKNWGFTGCRIHTKNPTEKVWHGFHEPQNLWVNVICCLEYMNEWTEHKSKSTCGALKPYLHMCAYMLSKTHLMHQDGFSKWLMLEVVLVHLILGMYTCKHVHMKRNCNTKTTDQVLFICEHQDDTVQHEGISDNGLKENIVNLRNTNRNQITKWISLLSFISVPKF